MFSRVLSINVEADDVVTEIFHEVLAFEIAAGIRRPHVRRELAIKNIAQRHFIEYHLVLALQCVDLAEILVAPAVRSDLMTPVVHAFDDR